MTPPVYSFRQGHVIRGGVPAQAIGEELERIRSIHDGFTPQHIVEAAAEPDSTLHPCFTWDDAEAADRWRLEEARHIVRAISVTYENRPQPVRAFHSTQAQLPDGSPFTYYNSTRAIVQNISLYENTWRLAKTQIEGAQKALDDLEAMARQAGNAETIAKADTIAKASDLTRQAALLLEPAA